MEQLCTGMEGGIEDGIHYRHLLWKHHYQDNNCGVPIIDVRNLLIEENQTSMLWEVWYECTSDVQYIFNFYLHWFILVIQDAGGVGHYLHSNNG